MKKVLMFLAGIVVLLAFTGCHDDYVYNPYTYNYSTVPMVTNQPNSFVINFTGHAVQYVFDQPIQFSSRKLKLSIISGNTYQLGDLIIQLYLRDNSMPYTKTVKANSSNLSIEEIFTMDEPPARIVVDINDYSAAFTMELLAVQ